jgi:phosphoribosylamine-glycine ligase
VGDTYVVFDSSGEEDTGRYMEELRSLGVPTIGSGKFAERIERERDFSMEMMKYIGCDIPDYQVFHTITETIQHVWHNRHKGLVLNGKVHEKLYFKSNAFMGSDATRSADSPEDLIRFLRNLRSRSADRRVNILQEMVDGPAVSTGRWWNGRSWVGPYLGTIELKKTFAGDIGPSTGCALNAVWFYPEEEPLIAKALKWGKLAATFLKYEAPPGWYDVNAILKDGKAWFLEWTPRFGWDSELTSLPLLYENLADWFKYIATGVATGQLGLSNQIAYAVRVGVPPYPWEHAERDGKGTAVGTAVWGKPLQKLSGETGFIAMELKKSKFNKEYEIAAPSGLVGLACATGPKLSELHERVLQTIKEIKTSSALVYRSDGDESICEIAEDAIREGFTMHPGLTQ